MLGVPWNSTARHCAADVVLREGGNADRGGARAGATVSAPPLVEERHAGGSGVGFVQHPAGGPESAAGLLPPRQGREGSVSTLKDRLTDARLAYARSRQQQPRV